MRLVAYARVSSLSQEDNTSLESQRSKIEAYCHALGHELVEVYQDVASAKDLRRPGLQSALEQLHSVDGLIIVKLDRLSRSTKDTLTLIEDTFKATDKNLVSITEQIDTSTAGGKMFLTMIAAFAEFERAQIRERVVGGKMAKMAKDENAYIHGAPRFGTKADNKALAIDDQELETIALIKRHRRSGKSFRQIAEYLNGREIKGKHGGKWTAHQIKVVASR